jgi:hypothetical protein
VSQKNRPKGINGVPADPVVDDLTASVVSHIFPTANFFTLPKASNAETGLAINSANADTQ